MAANPVSTVVPKPLGRRDRGMFMTADDNAMVKQVQATHDPDGREFNVKPILVIVEDILHRGTPSIDDVINGKQHLENLEDRVSLTGVEGLLEALAYIIQKVGCEMSCKSIAGGDAHATTTAVLHTLANYSWDAKVVISLAAFAVHYGEFWLVTQLFTINPLAKSIGLLKQIPEIIEHANSLKPQFEALYKLLKAVIEVTKCIVELRELPRQYIVADAPPLSTAMAHVPTAAYWSIRSIVACASLLARHEFMSTSEAWELSSLAHKINNIHNHLKQQLSVCYQHIDEKIQIEAYQILVRLFETLHIDSMKILRALFCIKDDHPPLIVGTTQNKVSIEILKRKNVLLLISDLDLNRQEVEMLASFYEDSHEHPDYHYEVVWLPIVDRSVHWNETHQSKFVELQSLMPWYTVQHPSTIELQVIKYIKEVWHFSKKTILVPLDPQGRVQCPNALHMLWIWGNPAFPFTIEREVTLWKAEVWRLELIVDGIDINILQWMTQGKYVCLCGGEDIEWIRKFTKAARAVATAAGISLEMIYVGKSNPKERIRKINNIITTENLSHCWSNLTLIWFFWTRMESIFYSKMQHGKSIENDKIMQEVTTLLSFDGSDQGWAIFFKGTDMARAKGDLALISMEEFEKWKKASEEHGFLPALKDHLDVLHTPHHCNRLILPGIDGGIPEKVVCAECGRPMEKFFMYRCCVE